MILYIYLAQFLSRNIENIRKLYKMSDKIRTKGGTICKCGCLDFAQITIEDKTEYGKCKNIGYLWKEFYDRSNSHFHFFRNCSR